MALSMSSTPGFPSRRCTTPGSGWSPCSCPPFPGYAEADCRRRHPTALYWPAHVCHPGLGAVAAGRQCEVYHTPGQGAEVASLSTQARQLPQACSCLAIFSAALLPRQAPIAVVRRPPAGQQPHYISAPPSVSLQTFCLSAAGQRSPAGGACRAYAARQVFPPVYRGQLQERPAGADLP